MQRNRLHPLVSTLDSSFKPTDSMCMTIPLLGLEYKAKVNTNP